MIKIENLKDKIILPIKKYYVGLLLFTFSTIGIMILIKNGYYNIHIADNSMRLILTLIYGGVLSIIIRSIIERIHKKTKYANLLYILIPVIMALVYLVVLHDISIITQLFKYFFLCLITIILFLIIPFIGRKEDSDYYSYRVIISLILTEICYFLLMIGIFFVIYSISILFEISIKEYLYPEISVFILGIIMPTLFLSLLPNKELERKDYPNFIKKIATYIIYPVLGVYTIILYAYFIKILFEFKWPSNMLGNLVLPYSLISIIVLYFTSKMKNSNKLTDGFIRIYPYGLIVPMIMMLVSFLLRINQYGFTEARYYSLMCFIFVMISILILKTKNKVKYILLTLSILLFISAFGPLSSFDVSKLSQEKRFEKILIKHNMLKDNTIIRNSMLSQKTKQEIWNILIYFEDNHQLSDLDVLPKDFKLDDLEETFGFSNSDF